MIEISLSKVKKNFGFKNVLDEFDLEVLTGEKIGLIGENGSGKSTIFKLITKDEEPTSGTISVRKGAKVSMLSQMAPVLSDDETVRDYLYKDYKIVFELYENMKKLEEQMSVCDPDDLEKIFKLYDRLQQKFIELDGYNIDVKINEICSKFNISEDMLNRSFNLCSGGEKTLIQLAKIMLQKPDILLLDEPTNNLDLNTLEWLEKYLSSFKGTVLMSSHDRYFLDKVATKIVLIERGKSESFFGNYSYYLEENERRILAEFENFKNQQKMIEAMKKKIKQLQEFGKLAYPKGENFFRRAASIQKRLDKIELVNKPVEQKQIPLNFQMDNRSGKQVLIVNNLQIGYDNNILLDDANFFIKFKDKVCLIGKNGCGKSSLIKRILDASKTENDPNIKIGSNVSIGYIPQVIDFEDNNEKILDYARKSFNGTETQLRAALAKFLFYSDDVFKRVGTLSGGEKIRLKLFELIQKNVNLLILDEPTNHIDIATREVLEDALLDYDGTVFFVSHDRYFIDKVAEKILAVENGTINSYLGNYSDYKEAVLKKEKLLNDNFPSKKLKS